MGGYGRFQTDRTEGRVRCRLENFCDSQHGNLRITVTKGEMAVEYFAVPDPSSPATKPLQPFDTLNIAF